MFCHLCHFLGFALQNTHFDFLWIVVCRLGRNTLAVLLPVRSSDFAFFFFFVALPYMFTTEKSTALRFVMSFPRLHFGGRCVLGVLVLFGCFGLFQTYVKKQLWRDIVVSSVQIWNFSSRPLAGMCVSEPIDALRPVRFYAQITNQNKKAKKKNR